MKAAVMYEGGAMPQYADFQEPAVQGDDQLLISMTAAAIKNLDKSRASGQHYSSVDKSKAEVVGGDGIGKLPDGTRVYAIGESGTIAERALVEKDRMVKLPEEIDDAVAAALPNAVIGSAMGLLFRAKLQPGETVLINGATGFTGRVAVQVARLYGAKRIIATGRNSESLNSLIELGADQVVLLDRENKAFTAKIKEIHQETPIDVVIDYLWGQTAEMIIDALKGQGSFTHRVRYVSIGSVAGDKVQLSAAALRSCDLQLSGSGLGSWTKEEVRKLFADILPEVLQLAADGKLKIDVIRVEMKDIETLWDIEVPDGHRLVVMI